MPIKSFDADSKKLRSLTRFFWVLLIYIIAALIWWFISLMHQSQQMRAFQVNQLNATIDSATAPAIYQREFAKIKSQEKRDQAKFIGEGLTFLGITLIGALFVFRSVRRQLRVQQQQQNFMMAVTHEFKTPIAVAKLNLETMLKRKLDDQKQSQLLQKTLLETERLNNIANNILYSSQLNEKGYRTNLSTLNLNQQLEAMAETFLQRFPERSIEFQENHSLQIKGDPNLIQLLISNLLENAIKYSPRQGKITIGTLQNGFFIQDEGPGIPAEEKNMVFEKFYRIGNEQTRKAQGTGLGLFLCKKIAELHQATIQLQSASPPGLLVSVHFPLEKNQNDHSSNI